MDVRITTRHNTISDALLKRAEERARKLGKYDPRILTVAVLFEEDHGNHAVELRADVPGVPSLVARAEGETNRNAFDRAFDKIRRRLRRERTKRIEHQAPPSVAVVES